MYTLKNLKCRQSSLIRIHYITLCTNSCYREIVVSSDEEAGKSAQLVLF